MFHWTFEGHVQILLGFLFFFSKLPIKGAFSPIGSDCKKNVTN